MNLLWPHVDVLYGAAWHLTGRDRVEDCVQEALLRAWKYLDTLQEAGNSRAWLLSILRNVIVDDRRRWNRRATADIAELGEEIEDPRPTGIGAGIVAEEVRQAIAALPPGFRGVLLLSVVQGLLYREIAEVLGIPMGTVMSRLHRGRRLLQERLMPDATRKPGDPLRRGRS